MIRIFSRLLLLAMTATLCTAANRHFDAAAKDELRNGQIRSHVSENPEQTNTLGDIVGDGINRARVFQNGGGFTSNLFQSNTIVLSPSRNVPLISYNDWDRANATGIRFVDNTFVFSAGSRGDYQFAADTGIRFEGNQFPGAHEGLHLEARGPLHPEPFGIQIRPSSSQERPQHQKLAGSSQRFPSSPSSQKG